MPHYQIRLLSSVEELLAVAEPWDQLWERSQVSSPMNRARLLALGLQKFGAPNLRIIVVESAGSFLAALPLMDLRWAKLFTLGGQIGNSWSPGGDLLLDESPDVDTHAALRALMQAMHDLPCPLYMLRFIRSTSTRWQQFAEIAPEIGFKIDRRQRFLVSNIPVRGAWEAYTKTWSKNHRSSLSRSRKNLESVGEVRLVRHSQLRPAEIEPLLRSGFEIEDRSWKGHNGTSVLRTPGMFEFYVEQAQQLARGNHLEIACLQVDDRPIAFEYLWRAKRVMHSFKVGYDEEFAKFGPGKLLLHELLQSMFAEGAWDYFDCLGPESDDIRRWRGESYNIDQLLLAPKKMVGRTLLYAYQNLWRHSNKYEPSLTLSAPQSNSELEVSATVS